MTLYGNLPTDLGLVGEDINCDEMMYYLYLPVKLKGGWSEILEPRLFKYTPIIDAVFKDVRAMGGDWENSNIYLTVKTVFVSHGCMSQRAGWHSDGFMTDDINYIWYTDVPTMFWDTHLKYGFIQDHEQSIHEMRSFCGEVGRIKRYPNRHLLRMDETVIHKTDITSTFFGVRTFVKVSVSDHTYALKGNSVNPYLPLGVEYKEREETRNCPVTHK